MVGVELQKYPGGNVTPYKAETFTYKSPESVGAKNDDYNKKVSIT
jgi:hypothetical protein